MRWWECGKWVMNSVSRLCATWISSSATTGELMDSPTLSLEEYDIPATGIIQIEEKNFTVTVVLPTGNEKLFNISKAKTVLDLKERIAVSLMFRCFLVVSLHSVSELGSSERRNGACRTRRC